MADTPNGKPFCFCPKRLVWDGKSCRSDIPLSKQCGLEGGIVRVTKEFVGSGKCEPVLDVPLFNERMILFYVKRLYCCNL